MTVFSPPQRPDISLATSGSTFSNGVIAHPLQKSGTIPHLSSTPKNYTPFRGVGTSVTHALQNLSKRGGDEGSGTIF